MRVIHIRENAPSLAEGDDSLLRREQEFYSLLEERLRMNLEEEDVRVWQERQSQSADQDGEAGEL